jgi:2OG-Fe(II) oxygenase superfamily
MNAAALPLTARPAFFDPGNLDRADTLARSEPFHFLIAHHQLPSDSATALYGDFPRYAGAGFFPYEEKDCGPTINRLIGDLTDPAVATAVGAKLGIDNLGQYPTLVTLCRALNKRHGTIHTDSKSKVATALLYLNESWPDTSAGCFRFLARVDSIDDVVAPEVKPIYGNFVVFKRADNSFHGHLPFEGDRRVIQVAWLTSEDEKLRKTKRGKLSRLFKKLFGSLDRRIGAQRADNAAHKD